MLDNKYDILGVGIGPFHLSLAALLKKSSKTNSLFLDQKPHFQWHPELMFNDADMQTTFIKDLVTPVDPTSPFSFLNYLVTKGQFYSFLNTSRKVITRKEFELYCQWVSQNLAENLKFNSQIEAVTFERDQFLVKTKEGQYTSQNLSIATGLIPRIPEFTKKHIGPKVFHAKSGQLKDINLTGKRVLIIGGGQTGVEVFRNALNAKWGRVENLRLVSRRQNLEPLDESPFTNEYFTPDYIDQFFDLPQESKDPIVKSQKLSSDGNTPHYLIDLYNELYQMTHVDQNPVDFKILPSRSMIGLTQDGDTFNGIIYNNFIKAEETIEADYVILCTGFQNSLPKFLDPITHLLNLDSENRIQTGRNFDIDWKGPKANKIYALNFSRHRHGIAEPQTSLMAWRSATIVNDILQEELYATQNSRKCFVQYGKID